MMYVVRYTGPFGYIKPWTAVRDIDTYSQTFLTPSIIEGMRQKLEVSTVLRHRLQHQGMNKQQERTQSAGWRTSGNQASRSLAIINRYVMLQPELHLAFSNREDAENAAVQHLCLCRNEDVLFPVDVTEMTEQEFENLPGVELKFEQTADAFLVGYDRFNEAAPMYGHIVIVDTEGNGAEQ